MMEYIHGEMGHGDSRNAGGAEGVDDAIRNMTTVRAVFLEE